MRHSILIDGLKEVLDHMRGRDGYGPQDRTRIVQGSHKGCTGIAEGSHRARKGKGSLASAGCARGARLAGPAMEALPRNGLGPPVDFWDMGSTKPRRDSPRVNAKRRCRLFKLAIAIPLRSSLPRGCRLAAGGVLHCGQYPTQWLSRVGPAS